MGRLIGKWFQVSTCSLDSCESESLGKQIEKRVWRYLTSYPSFNFPSAAYKAETPEYFSLPKQSLKELSFSRKNKMSLLFSLHFLDTGKSKRDLVDNRPFVVFFWCYLFACFQRARSMYEERWRTKKMYLHWRGNFSDNEICAVI